jgi:hypothetical protein
VVGWLNKPTLRFLSSFPREAYPASVPQAHLGNTCKTNNLGPVLKNMLGLARRVLWAGMQCIFGRAAQIITHY